MYRIKKFLTLFLTLALLCGLWGFASLSAVAAATTVQPSSSKVMIDGTAVSFQAYNIDGYNYFKLRDIAMAISGTEKQYEVGFDDASNAISLTSGQPYTPVGGELVVSDDLSSREATASAAKVYLDGAEISPRAYFIDGNNYFRLRDIGAAIDFGVIWGSAGNTITLDTSSSYVSDMVGFFDSGYYYTNNPEYSVMYMMSAEGNIYNAFRNSFKSWADKLNCTYDDFSSRGDNDLFLESLETYTLAGTDGFLLDADSALYPRISELMTELNVPWMSCMTQALDDNGQKAHPAVIYDNYDIGAKMAQWTIDYAKKTWPDADPAEIGMLSLDFSIAPALHDRTVGAQDVWNEAYPDQESNFYVGDGVSGPLDSNTAYVLSSAAFASDPDIQYWLICACIDDYANGAAQAAEAAGIDDRCVVVTCGGTPLMEQWDAGQESCWKAALYTDYALYSEPMICGLYAMMNGDATAETLWPEWINKNAGDTYASVQLPMVFITQGNYTEYLEWVDSYTGFNNYDYAYGGTQYELRATPPDSYNS